MNKNTLTLVLTTVICASVMLAVVGIYRFFAKPILKKPEALSETVSDNTDTEQIYYNPLAKYCQE